MSETACSEGLAESEKPVQVSENIQFPPFPEPTDEDFDDDICQDERSFYMTKFKDLNTIIYIKIHCTACDRHLGLCPKNENRMRTHPMLRTLVCQTCLTFYNSGEFERGDDGSELYCRWCGQGGQVYCCSECPHVFCAKCIKRNLGLAKIKEIEELDDWKCFKCNFMCLRDLRAICWAAQRYCNLKNNIANKTEDSMLKESYLQDCAQDHSECCKTKHRRKEKLEAKKKETEAKKTAASVISKIPPTIQVKKFASINLDEGNKQDNKKATKRYANTKANPVFVKNPITVAHKIVNTFHVSPMKKVRLPSPSVSKPIRIIPDRKSYQQANKFIKIRPKSQFPVVYNGRNTNNQFSNVINNDNINLSLESLTQGVDMSAMSIASSSQDELVCTPDFPIEPLCEVTEDNTDDDVQCITPAPVSAPKGPPPITRSINLSEVSSDNIIQMTENDVTVNTATGGLKFRVDPQTLSSNKMYRLPDGRIFAINANPNLPGGYSATIVAVTETLQPKPTNPSQKANRQVVSTPPPLKVLNRNQINRKSITRQRCSKTSRSGDTPIREADFSVPVEWYRYNLIDAIDALEYSLSRLHRLKKEATTTFLRTRSVQEMRNLHRTLENLLNTSTHRFIEIRETINKELKQYIIKKTAVNSEDDDDDVEILPDLDDTPICIDENSLDSYSNEAQDVDLTEGGSEHNDSEEKCKETILEEIEKDEDSIVVPVDLPSVKDNRRSKHKDIRKVKSDKNLESLNSVNLSCNESVGNAKKDSSKIKNAHKLNQHMEIDNESEKHEETDDGTLPLDGCADITSTQRANAGVNKNHSNVEELSQIEDSSQVDHVDSSKEQIRKTDQNIANGKSQGLEISDQMIDDFLKDDGEGNRKSSDINSMDISDENKEP